MNDSGSPPLKRMRLSGEELTRINKDEIISLYMKQQVIIEELQSKLNDGEKDGSVKCKTQLAETSRRENVLVMRLATKEQEIQQYAAQISHIKKSQEDIATKSLRQAMLDPAVNLIFTKMKDELMETKDKLEQAQSELSAWKFTPDSQTGKKLMSRCRTLIAENQELGRQLSQGKVAQLEAELALQKKYSEELKETEEELNELVIQLDEEVEGMQSTIQFLQQQLIESKREVGKYKNIVENGEYERPRRTNGPEKEIRTKAERRISPKKETRDMDLKNFKNEVGDHDMLDPDVGEGSPDVNKRSFENSEFVCKEECNSVEGEETAGENADTMEVDDANNEGMLGENKNEGENTPTYSEHEIIDESRGTTPERTPEREYSDTGDVESANGDRGYSEPCSTGSNADNESPINEETYEIIDNGSDDETEHVTHIVSTTDETFSVMEEEYVEPLKPNPVVTKVSKEYRDTSSTDTRSLEKVDKNIIEQTNGEVSDSPAEVEQTGTAVEDTKIRTREDTNVAGTQELANEETVSPTDNTEETRQDQKIVPVPNETAPAEENAVETTAAEAEKENAEAKPKPTGGEQVTLPPVPQPIVPQTPIMPAMSAADPAAAYLMNPHFQQLPSTTLAQQQALMAEQASLMYKTILAQQQQQLAMAEEKNAPAQDGSGAARTGEEMRTMNPLMHGLPYTDPSAAFLAQYKAMLAAQQMLIPGPDGKMPQMLAPGGLGLYPGLPIVQPTMLAQPSTDPATNGVTSSWATNTNVTYTPHPLIPQGFLGATPTAGLMMYPGPNLTPHAMTPIVDGEKHQGSGDHGPLQNGLPEQKPPETTETNPKEDSKVAV